MNSYFSPGDWAIICVYLLSIIALGLWFGKDQHNTRDYFLGSKNVPWWGIGLSIVAAETSALTIIGVPAMAYGGNIAFLQMIIGYVIARIILAIVLVPHYFKGEIYSPYELFARAFGPAARQTAGGFFLISETLAAGVRVYVASIPVKLMLGDRVLKFGTGDPILGAILLFVLLSLLYTYIGGVKAVIWTDAVQFALFLLGGLFALWYIPSLVEGGTRAMLWVFYQGHTFQIPLPEPRPGSGIKANDFIFPIFMMTEVPHVLKGFLIVAILSAAMSSVSSALTSLASVSTMDFVRHAVNERSERFYLRFSKISTIAWAAALILIAYVSRKVEFVLNAAFSLRGLTSGALLGGLALAVFWRKGRSAPVIVGMLISLAVMTLIQLLP